MWTRVGPTNEQTNGHIDKELLTSAGGYKQIHTKTQNANTSLGQLAS